MQQVNYKNYEERKQYLADQMIFLKCNWNFIKKKKGNKRRLIPEEGTNLTQ